ncbi:uncharacterized protein [Aristolochia californica]|uniref:uncharacterized protein isoform X2 n=1 Tax=Aristolochia californica TaxID=171875 RepID=UPI0035DFCB3F
MSLACLVCHSVDSPSQSFRSYSDNEGRCSAIVNCLNRKALSDTTNSTMTSKVTPQPIMASTQGIITGPPRLVRSHAVRRDLVRDWNFDELLVERYEQLS